MATLADYDHTEVLTVPEAGKVLRIGSRSAAYEAARRGQIPTIRVGRQLRVPKHRLERLLQLGNNDDPAEAGPQPKDSSRVYNQDSS